ncbi:hypothetical protein BCV69DRAFT_214279 [Microstroma glucosiphilum]|uniref:Uncharacterized protein n=1 Tax=Pseudomicrostroma glucosiphilum TaxID=1684307 RepID=A0A316U6J9_9BASI|nr:hypothetical protein BCV69DRAFT_214279 [Pseudomicrostroma glucosiphilum]PWN19963.1 hypothetical protein BCV69DRAFT_214279 [Pseudomicrostroma glucosiphilum]
MKSAGASASPAHTQGDERPHHWDELADGLREQGVYDNHEGNGIPQRYLNGSEATRAAVLAGLLDADGWLVNGGTPYEFAQSVDLKIIENTPASLRSASGSRWDTLAIGGGATPSRAQESSKCGSYSCRGPIWPNCNLVLHSTARESVQSELRLR